ncbi:MAG: endonuclease III domain-containing protein [Desulfobulbaceae bacterium]|nr:endonuclease III domain-containing protein [Desulfobulbaceae bacterium]
MANRIQQLYDTLLAHFGPQHWWPGDTPFEVMIGAVLTQNTNWLNVSRALDNLKAQGLLSFERLESLPVESLAENIRPSGYYNQKAKRLKGLLAAIRADSGDLETFFAQDPATLRDKLLQVKGIGPETADSILLYAAEKQAFVVDAYTHRILCRHNLIAEESDYHEIQEVFVEALPAEIATYNEYHALLVRLGKDYCKKTNPLCKTCPLADF